MYAQLATLTLAVWWCHCTKVQMLQLLSLSLSPRTLLLDRCPYQLIGCHGSVDCLPGTWIVSTLARRLVESVRAQPPVV